MSRLDKQREAEQTPMRYEFAKQELSKLGVNITFDSKKEIRFIHKGSEVRLFIYTGWHTGKTINDGRGINNLLSQLK